MSESEFKKKVLALHYKADKKALTLEKFNETFYNEILRQDSANYPADMLAMYENDLMKIRAQRTHTLCASFDEVWSVL
jgi:hypothetical protein